MNCRILPVLNKLDQDPREELDDETDWGAAGTMTGDGILGHPLTTGDIGLVVLLPLTRLK